MSDENVEEVQKEKADKFNLRNFIADDIFSMTTIISKIGIEKFMNQVDKDMINKLTEKNNEEENNEETKNKKMETIFALVGIGSIMNIVKVILGNLVLVKEDLYILLSDLSEMTTEEISKLSMGDFTRLVIQVIKKDDFKDFMKVVSELF